MSDTTYIIETRKPATEERVAGEWHSDGMGDGPVIAESEDEAQSAIEQLRALGSDWTAAEYRYRPVGSRELVRLVAAKGGMFAKLAEHLDGVLDEADRMAARQLRGRAR
jgi:hypothetical protein